jgi:hypothetical protein
MCAHCGAEWSVDPDESWNSGSDPMGFRLELGEPHVDEALDDLLEID